MDVKPATQRYMRLFIPTMLLFLLASLGLAWLDRTTQTGNLVLAALAIVPIAALLSMFWLHWHYLRDLDEFLRQIQVKGLLFGAAVALGIATGWGYLESYADAPALSVFWLNPIFWMAYAVGVVGFSRREGVSLR